MISFSNIRKCNSNVFTIVSYITIIREDDMLLSCRLFVSEDIFTWLQSKK